MTENHPLRNVSVNPVCCNGCGTCAAMAPEIFEMDPLTEKAMVICDECPEEPALLAQAYCPHDCIEVD